MARRLAGWMGLGVVCGTALLTNARADERRAIKPDDLVAIRRVSDVQISPDGSRVAFVVTEPGDPKKPEAERDSNIWIVRADGTGEPRPFATSPRSDTSPRWSPDGRTLAFLSSRGDPQGDEKETKNQIYLLRTDGGEAEPLTSGGGEVAMLKWSADGSLIAYTVIDPPTNEEQQKKKERDDAIAVDRDYKFARLWVVRLSDRTAAPITKQDLNVNDFSWSPDGSELALSVSPTPKMDDISYRSSLVVVNRKSGEVVRRLVEKVSDASPAADWSPDGKTIAYTALTAKEIASLPALVPSAGGAARTLLGDYPGTAFRCVWAPDSKSLVSFGIEGAQAKALRIDTASGAVTRLADVFLDPSDYPVFNVTADGRTIAYAGESADSPADVWALTFGKPAKRLTRLNPQTGSLALGTISAIQWKNAKDGQVVHGVLLTPPGFRQGQPYPTVVIPHGGPEWAMWIGWHDLAELLASNGYVVLLPNPRGSDGQGWRFVEANRDDWGGMDFRDIMDGLDDLVGKKIADPDRLGIGGWSYGGFMTSWAVTQTGRFKAAVVGAAVTDLFSMFGTTDIPTFQVRAFLDLPFRRRATYDGHSPMSYIQNCKTPSLILHGQADDRVPVSQGWEFYTGLRALGVEAEMVVYPREPHGFKERAHEADRYRRILDWYDRHLKPTTLKD